MGQSIQSKRIFVSRIVQNNWRIWWDKVAYQNHSLCRELYQTIGEYGGDKVSQSKLIFVSRIVTKQLENMVGQSIQSKRIFVSRIVQNNWRIWWDKVAYQNYSLCRELYQTIGEYGGDKVSQSKLIFVSRIVTKQLENMAGHTEYLFQHKYSGKY